MKRLTRDEILDYEVCTSWWAEWIGNDFLQGLVAKYFAWKVNRKYNRYLHCLERRRLLNQMLDETDEKVTGDF